MRNPFLISFVLLILLSGFFPGFPGVSRGDEWIPSWNCLGVFDNADGNGMDRNPFQFIGSEADCLFDAKTRETINTTSPTLTFHTACPNDKGFVDFVDLFGEQKNKFAYAWTTISCASEGYAILRAGSDDGIRIWINGKETLKHIIYRAANPDQEVLPVFLSKGENKCVVKLDQGAGYWGFYLSLSDIMPEQKGVHLKPVLDIIPPRVIVGSTNPIQQNIYLNLFNHGTLPGKGVRISCRSPLLKETFSEESDFPVTQIVQVSIPLEAEKKARPNQEDAIILESIFEDGPHCPIGEIDLQTIEAHPLLQEKNKKDKDSFFIVQISDPHIVTREIELSNVKTADRLEIAVREINEMNPAPDFVIITGDILLDNIEGYPLYYEIVSQLKVPRLDVFGNHDKPRGLLTSERIFSEKGLPPYYAFQHKGYWFYILDGIARSNPPFGRIGAKQMEWLDDLLKVQTTNPRLFFLHHDLFSGRGIENYQEVQEMLKKHPGEKWFFTGHWHADCFVKKGDQRHIVTTSIGYLFDQDKKFKHSRQIPGYRLIYFKDGRISTQFKPLGKPPLPDPELKDYFTIQEILAVLKQ